MSVLRHWHRDGKGGSPGTFKLLIHKPELIRKVIITIIIDAIFSLG